MKIIRDKDITYYSEEELREMPDVDIAYLLVATDTKLLQQNKNRGKLSICLNKVIKSLIESTKSNSPNQEKKLYQGEPYRSKPTNKTTCVFFELPETQYYCPPRTVDEAKRPFVYSKEFRKQIDDIFRD